MRHDPHICHPSTGTTTRELNPPPAEDPTGLSTGFIIIHPCGGCLSGVYDAIISDWIPHRISTAKRAILRTLVAICRRHDILHLGIRGGCAHLIHHYGHFLRLLWPTIEPSEIVFHQFQTISEELAGCSRILATPIGTLPIRYLGMSLVDRRLRMQDWHPVIEKVETRLEGWRARQLSRGGHLVLLKAVLVAIPTYFMTIFRMPVGVRRRLEQMMRGFFWLGSRPEESRGVALVEWETVCRPVDQGGLGVWQLLHTNTTLLSKWVCRLL